MKMSILKHLAVIMGLVMISLMGVYVGLAIYYHNAFAYRTWINGVYCTGKSIQEVNDELVKDFNYEGLTIYDKDGNAFLIPAEQIAYQFDFGRALEIYQKQQNSWMWVDSLFHEHIAELTPVVSYSQEEFEACFAALPICLEKLPEEDCKVEIVKTSRGYELINERADVLNLEAAKKAMIAAIEDSRTDLYLVEEGCYHDLALTDEMHSTLQLWERLDAFQQCGIVYQMGEEELPLDASVVSEWIALKEDGSFLLDEAGQFQLREGAIEEFVKELAAEYDTVGVSRQFRATRGELVTVEGGLYGNRIDQKAEVTYLTQAFEERRQEIHKPSYLQEAWVQGKEDIGATYIEVDMKEQKMYYYVNGVLQIDTPIVTGNVSRRMGTPSGVNYVYLKQTDRILRGANYASHVDFWMPVKGNIGIHDAAWRDTFGGEIFKTNGSHGCINTPREAMERLFDMAPVGTPVVMFY